MEIISVQHIKKSFSDGVIVEEGEPKQLINNPQTNRLKDFLKRFNQ